MNGTEFSVDLHQEQQQIQFTIFGDLVIFDPLNEEELKEIYKRLTSNDFDLLV